MNEPLAVYMHDHLQGSKFALTLLESLIEQRDDSELAEFARQLLDDIQQDRETLSELLERVDNPSFRLPKEAVTWVAQKASWLGLRHMAGQPLGTFLELEMIALGIQGKLSLWNALKHGSGNDPRLAGVNLDHLIQRAEDQHHRVEQHRLHLGRTVLFGGSQT